MQVAKDLSKSHKNIYFELIGEGALKQDFIDFKNKYELNNLAIKNLISKVKVPQVLKNSDVLYLGLKDSPLYRFGMSLNKLFDYLAAEVPIVFSSNIKDNPVKEANAGLCIPAENEKALKEAIISIYEMKEEQKKVLAEGNLAYVEKKFSISRLTNTLEETLKKLV